MARSFALTDSQLALLRVVWARGEATVIDVHRDLSRERPVAQPTVATMLSRLERKGVLAHRVEGRQFVYRALVSEAEVRRSVMGNITERLFTGDVPALISQLLAERDVSREDLDAVKAMIAAKERELARGARRGGRRRADG
jgi:predicted transcriptional regulator